jgi:glycosyltransferase involved in cell wall biosynthesis
MHKAKTILFLLHIPPPVHGASIIGQSIKDSLIINQSFDCRYINIILSHTIKDTGKTELLKMIRFVRVWFNLLKELIKKKPDVCYLALTATGVSFYKDVFLIGLIRFFHVKIVYHLHNKGVKKFQTKKINELLYRYVFKDADVILLSKLLFEDIETFVPIERVHICPNGVLDYFSTYKPHLVDNTKPIRIIFLSNLIKTKGVFVLLEALTILKQRRIIFECFFIGQVVDLPLSKFSTKVEQLGLKKHVTYLGKKFGVEKQEILRNAEIFVLPTYYSNECFPLVILEAMSAGLPVISTFEGGIPDIVEESVTGYLVQQRDPKMLAEKLDILIHNSELRQQMGEAGRKKFERQFTLYKFEHKLKGILQQITNL